MTSVVLVYFLCILLPVIVMASGMASVPVLAGVAALLAWRQWRAPQPLDHRLLRSLAVILGCFLIWPLLSSLWSIDPGLSLRSWASVAALCLAGGWMMLALPRLPERVLLGIALSMGLACVVLLSEMIGQAGFLRAGLALAGTDYERFMDKNAARGVCALSVLVWPLLLGLAQRSTRTQYAAWALWASVATLALYSESASAVMAMSSASLLWAVVYVFPRRGPRILAVLLVLKLAAWPLAFSALHAPVLSAPPVYDALPSSFQHRLDIWRFTLDRAMEKPWGGWGMNTSRIIPGGTVVYAPDRAYLPLHPHNSVLHVLLEGGVVGLGAALLGIVFLVQRWKAIPDQQRLEKATFGATLTAYLAIGFTAFGVWQNWWIATAWFAAALLHAQREDIKT